MKSRAGWLLAALAPVVAAALIAGWVMQDGKTTSDVPAGRGFDAMGRTWLSGNGLPVESMAQARRRADRAATSAGLRTGEVMWFTRNFYVELEDRSGRPATEVLVDPRTGRVSTEPGPASMWNSDYGMHRWTARDGGIGEVEARHLASAWLLERAPGAVAGEADVYPGYITFHVERGGDVTGMLSVNTATGRVWYHSWHGRLIDMDAG